MSTKRKQDHTRMDRIRKLILVMAAIVVLIVPAMVMAQPRVAVSITAEKEVTVVKNGEKTTKKVMAKTINPGDVIYYSLNYSNSGDEVATNVVLDDPIPLGTAYLPGSVVADGAEVSFSIDGGKTFKKPSLLSYEVKNPDGSIEKRSAAPEEYTTIRWIIAKIAPSAKGIVGFQVKVKK